MRIQTQLLTLFLANGLLFSGLAIPMIRGMVPRNGLYGFRVPKTLASDAVWYPANRYMGRCLLVSGAILVAGILLLWPFAGRWSVAAVGWLGLALTMLPLLVSVYLGFRYLEEL
jgi:uncharacterized membrane protein